MGLLAGGLSFRRYRVVQPLPDGFRDQYLASIQHYAHQENLKHRSKEPVMGWVSVRDPADTEFDLNKVLYDHYFVLGLRIDKKTLPAKLFAILLERKYREIKQERGVERLGKNHKLEIKEALEEELLGQNLPTVNIYDVAWDIGSGEVLFFGTSEALNDYVRGFFHDTFQMRLYPDRMVDWLARRMSWEEIETRAQAHLPGGTAAGGHASQVNAEGWHENDPLSGRELLLGTEFLTWLWHESEARDGHFSLPEDAPRTGKGAITERDYTELDLPAGFVPPEPAGPGEEEIVLWLDNKLIFKDLQEDQPGVTMMSGAAPSTTPEAKLTLVQGKRPVECRLGFKRGDYEWFFTLRALPSGLELSGLKIPAEVKDGDEEKVYERMYLIEVATNAVRKLFLQFFQERTSPGWGEGLEAWMNEEGE